MGFDPPKCFKSGEFMVLCQSFSQNHQTRAGFLAAMPRLLLPHSLVVYLDLAKAGSGVGEKRILVSFQRQALVASTVHDRCNRAAIAVQRIRGHNPALERDQAEHLKPCDQFATIIGGHRRKRQTKARCIGRHHHPRPSTLPPVACATQCLVIDGDDIPLMKKGRDVSQNPSESGIKSFGIDHPKRSGKRVVKRNRVFELQEAVENTFFRATKSSHLGTTRRAAEHGSELLTG